MKKILATVLCLTVTTPCFAAGFENHAPYGRDYDRQPRIERHIDNHTAEHRTSKTTKTLAAVAGIAGIAAIISAIAD